MHRARNVKRGVYIPYDEAFHLPLSWFKRRLYRIANICIIDIGNLKELSEKPFILKSSNYLANEKTLNPDCYLKPANIFLLL